MKVAECLVVTLMALLLCVKSSEAGAAVQAAKRKQATREQLLQERKILQTRAVTQQQAQVLHSINDFRPPAPQFSQPDSTNNRVSLNQFWQALNTSSQPWFQIVKPEDKAMVVLHYIKEFQIRGTKITKSPAYYAGLIDSMAANNPSLLANSFDRLLQMVAVMEYDFNNGQDKDILAKQLLGEQGYQTNKQRLLNNRQQKRP